MEEGILMTTELSYVMVFIEGILTFISPCILPMLPIYFVYLAGNAVQSNAERKRKLIINAIAFVLGFTIVFTLLGASATAIGNILDTYRDQFRVISGFIIIIFGLYFMGLIKISLLSREKRLQMNIKEMGFISAILFGMVFSFGWTPCAGPFLASVLLVASTSQTVVKGILLLMVYAMGLGIPFILTAILFDKLESIFQKITKHQRIIKIISGVILIMMGILMLTGKLQYLSTNWY